MRVDRNRFALGTWEIHLQTSLERQHIKSMSSRVCNYINTAIDYNNDYLLSNAHDYKIISKISSYHYPLYEFFVSNHLKCLRRDYIDIMLIHSSRGNWQELAKQIIKDNRYKEVGVSNFNITEIEEFIALTGQVPKYNEIEINPYYTDLETIKYCKDKGIKIIAYGIFGGKYNAMTYIADFSIPYLVGYALSVADMIVLKPESLRHTYELLDVVENCDFSQFQYNYSLSSTATDQKSIVPMRYTAKDIERKYGNILTYHNACGKNNIGRDFEVVEVELPVEFEMLGDYQTYLRYKYRQKYNDTHIYDYDLLIGDDGNYYAVHLFDDKGRLTKINSDHNVHAYRIRRQ